MLDFDAVMATAAPSEDVVPICLDGPLMRLYGAVKRRVDARTAEAAEAAEAVPTDVRLGGRAKPKADPEQPELDRLAAEVQARATPFLVKAMPGDDFVDFIADPQFKARTIDKGEVDPRDARLGLNAEVFIPALICASVKDPDLSVEGRWEQLRPVLASWQREKLFNAAWNVNREERDVPFSPSGSPSPLSSATA